MSALNPTGSHSLPLGRTLPRYLLDWLRTGLCGLCISLRAKPAGADNGYACGDNRSGTEGRLCYRLEFCPATLCCSRRRLSWFRFRALCHGISQHSRTLMDPTRGEATRGEDITPPRQSRRPSRAGLRSRSAPPPRTPAPPSGPRQAAPGMASFRAPPQRTPRARPAACRSLSFR